MVDQRYSNQVPSGEMSPMQSVPQYVFTSNYRFSPLEKNNQYMGGNYTLAPMQMQHTFVPAYGGYFGSGPMNYKETGQGVPSTSPPEDSIQRNFQYVTSNNQHEFVNQGVGHHRKSKSMPGGSSGVPLMSKFQNMQSNHFTARPSKSSGAEHSAKSVRCSNTVSGQIKYPIKQLSKTSKDIPPHKADELRAKVYPAIETKKYTTSAIDPIRNHLTVFEYMVNNHWIIWDHETGFVHLTGIWKASISGNQQESKTRMKADIVRLLESTPKQYQSYIKRIRGGFLKIQGTWLPFDLCRILARRFCYHIRYELVPIFGEDFPQYCLSPNDKGYGELKLTEITNISPKIIQSPLSESVQKQNESTFGVFDANSVDSTPTDSTSGNQFVFTYDKGAKSGTQKKRRTNMSLSPPKNNKTASTEGLQSPLIFNANRFPSEEEYQQKSPLSHTHGREHGLGQRSISLNDMMEIVNASKCLQSLSRSSSFSQSSSMNWETPSNRTSTGSLTSPESPTLDRSSSDVSDGISSILLAADLSKKTTLVPQVTPQHQEETTFKRGKIRIDDILT